jgi:hypothetical protein
VAPGCLDRPDTVPPDPSPADAVFVRSVLEEAGRLDPDAFLAMLHLEFSGLGEHRYSRWR